jgi:hypothetical protein
MHNLNSIYFFIFIFSTLIVIKNLSKFLIELLRDNPKPIGYSNRELLVLGLSISYIITYIFN